MATNSADRGFFRNAFEAMIAARQREANRYVDRMTAMYGDDLLPGAAGRSGDSKRV